jgi:hypothetical protein
MSIKLNLLIMFLINVAYGSNKNCPIASTRTTYEFNVHDC